MITEYTDCTEFMRLVADQKIKPSAVKKYLSSMGIILTSSNSETFAKDAYTILLGGKEMARITKLIISDGNYEKSVLINAKIRDTENNVNILDYFADGFNSLRSQISRDYMIEQPVKTDKELKVHMSYKRKLPGKNKLIEEETRYIKITIRKNTESTVSIDIRQPSSYDSQRALDLLKQITSSEESDVVLSHVNLELLTDKNKVIFFDRLSAAAFDNWTLKTVTGITVKRSNCDDEDENTETDDEGDNSALTGISQAILNGSGLRSNEFVQKSLEQGYFIASMKYRYICTKEAGEFIVSISSKNDNLRVDIDKSYCDEDGKLYVQPFPKAQQDEIIQLFQKASNDIFYQLLEEQKK